MKFKKPKFWDYKRPNLLSYLLLPLTLPILIKNTFFKKEIQKGSKLKKICVGNIYVGGTGKTPLAILISKIFEEQNIKTTIIKKYYSDQVDEQKLINKYSNIICKKNRLDALKEAEDKNFDCAIFDDGLQDKNINYDISIVCFSNSQWIGNGFLIPAGPLRENIASIKKYDAIVLNGKPSLNSKIIDEVKKINNKISIFESYYEPSNLDEFDRNLNYVAFSGIGNPDNFNELLKEYKFKLIKKFDYPDHYNFKDNDIEKIIKIASEINAQIITTEKDFLRISEKFQKKIKFLKLKLIINKDEIFKNFLRKDT